MLTIVSAYRSPAYDAAKCAGGKCNGIAKAKCSAHRTGTAVDLYVGAAPGFSPVSSDDENRLHQTQTPAYRWLVKNAARFGFVNYVFEPWHWEWVGDETQHRHCASRPRAIGPPRTAAPLEPREGTPGQNLSEQPQAYSGDTRRTQQLYHWRGPVLWFGLVV